jgi:hypothetical protein
MCSPSGAMLQNALLQNSTIELVDKLTLIAQCVLLAILRVTRFVFLRWRHHNFSSASESPSGTSYPGRTPRY